MSEEMPRNLIGDCQPSQRDDAAKEAQWLANNVPAEPLELRWRYGNGKIQLFERHLRSLAKYGIGPALISYLRTRLEWLKDNRVWERPQGVVVVTVDPDGTADARLDEARPLPELSLETVASLPGSLWAYFPQEGKLVCVPGVDQLKGASETLVRDLAATLGYELSSGEFDAAALAAAELAHVSDEFGFVALEGHQGGFTQKMDACFQKLWSK